MYSKICSAWIFVLISLGVKIFSTSPFSLISHVVRRVPMHLRPHMVFSPHAPSCCNMVVSVSAMRGKGSSYLSMNFWWLAAESLLMPTTV